MLKQKIDKAPQKRKCRFCGDRDETINYIIECSKLAQKDYKTRHEWVGEGDSLDSCKKFKFDRDSKWYICITATINATCEIDI